MSGTQISVRHRSAGRPGMTSSRLPSEAGLIYTATGLIASVIVRMAIRLRVQGAEHIPADGPALLVANHVSHFDPVVLSVIAGRRGRQVRLVAVQELFDKPLLGSLAKAIGWIPAASGQGSTTIGLAQAALAQGDLVLIYPEGTIPPLGVAVPARPGAAVIAIGARVPTIPIASDGLERGDRSGTWRRRRVTVLIGSPIDCAVLEAVAGQAGFAMASELLLTAVRGLAGTRPADKTDRALKRGRQ